MTNNLIDDPEFARNVQEQLFTLWVDGELGRRGLTRTDVQRALVIMPPSGPNEVRLNDEVELVAEIVASRPLAEGEPVTSTDIERIVGLRPYGVDPDAGYYAYAVVDGLAYIHFDFRRYKGEAGGRLAVARDYLETAKAALASDRLGPAIENAFAAAELAVAVQMRIFHLAVGNHRERREWWEGYVELGNAPNEHRDVLRILWAERSRARYAEGKLTLDRTRIEELVGHSASMVEDATRRAS